LVAKEVSERHDARAQPCHGLRQRALVDLEQPEIRPARGDESGRDPGEQVRARTVPGEAVVPAEDLRRHGRGRRLAVRRGHDRDSVRQPRGELVDRTGIDLPQRLAGNRRAASTTRDAGEAAAKAEM